jgi:hypothetical protein
MYSDVSCYIFLSYRSEELASDVLRGTPVSLSICLMADTH